MTIPGEQWWLEEILEEGGLTLGFILIHASKGRDVAARIDWDGESRDELREKLADLISELRELASQPAIWIKN